MKNKRILLLESALYKPYKLPQAYSNRVSAISPSSKQLLQGNYILNLKAFLRRAGSYEH